MEIREIVSHMGMVKGLLPVTTKLAKIFLLKDQVILWMGSYQTIKEINADVVLEVSLLRVPLPH